MMNQTIEATAVASRAKRIVKGGWVNVYRNVAGTMMFGCVHSTRFGADSHHTNRVACIQISDITEGEGLNSYEK